MDSLEVEIVLKASLTSLASISLLLLPSCVTLSKLLKFSIFSFLTCEVKVFVAQSCLFATAWTVAFQAPLSMEFARQKYWSG